MTLRALLIGLLLAATVGAAGPFLALYVQGSNSNNYFTSPIAHFLFFILVGVCNVALGALRRSWALSKGELLAIFILMSLANSTPNFVQYWVPLVSSPFYYASPENNWPELIHPYIPDWLVPRDPEAIRAFYEGAAGGSTQIPWAVWLVPIIGWLPLVLALYGGGLCLMVILRRQWMDQERLIYPIIQLPLAMVEEDERGSLIKPFFRNGVMWLGFSIPVLMSAVVGLHAYFSFIPTIQLHATLPFIGGIRLSFATLGFFFLIQREVAFGLWVFTLLNHAQEALYRTTGWGITQEPAVSVWSYGLPSLVHQSMGAMIVLVVGGLWVGREHLANVARKAFIGAADVDDSDEILCYRTAVWGLLLSAATMAGWLWSLGVSPLAILTFMLFAFVVFVALTRVVAEGGVAVIYAPLVAPDAVVSALGTALVGAPGLVGLAFARIFANDLLNFAMPHFANSLKLSGQISGRRWLFWGMLLAILLGLGGSLLMLMWLCYTYGAINLRPPHFIWLPNYVYDYTAARLSNPAEPNWLGWLHTGLGSVVMALLMLARRYWVWWPLHPIGFPISSVFHWMAFNAFLAWLIKGPILRYGGVRLYRAVRPFFLGMILGQFAIYGVFWIIDSFTGMVGNGLFP